MFVNCEQAILEACPQLRLGHLQAKVVVCDSSDRFWQVAEPILQARAELDASDIRQTPVLAEARKAYKALGQDPSRYRLSAEALNRRMMKKQSLYRISNLVDLINLLSLQTAYSIGGFDLAKIQGSVSLRKGTADDVYAAIGRGALNIKHLPVLVDQIGPFGNPSSDSERTCINTATQSVWLVFYDFGANDSLEASLVLAQKYLKEFAQAEELHCDIQICK